MRSCRIQPTSKTFFMKRLNLLTIIATLVIFAGCKKHVTKEKEVTGQGGQTEKSDMSCKPRMYSLTVDPGTGFSYIYGISGSPGAGPVTTSPYVVGGTNQLLTCGNVPITYATGITWDPINKEFVGVTGNLSSFPDHILRFSDPNCVTVTPAIDGCNGLNLDLSDIERDPVTGEYFAINRHPMMMFHNRIVKINLNVVVCLPMSLPVAIHARGLTFNCLGHLFIMDVAGMGGSVRRINKATGANFFVAAYPGNIAPAGAAFPEMGLHWDCDCIHRFITANFDPIGPIPIMTDGIMPPLGPVTYNVNAGVLRYTVDFARPE